MIPWKWVGAGAVVIVLLVMFDRWLDDVKTDAMAEQARLSAEDFRQAFEAAQAEQARISAEQRRNSAAKNKEQIDALKHENDRIGRDYADLRRLWREAKAEADPGGAGQGGAAAVPADAGGDPFAAARAAGWVDFDTAAAAAEAADRAAAAHAAAVNWWLTQCRAWPGPKPEECY